MRVLLAFTLLLLAAPALAEPADRTRFEDRAAEVSRHFADIGGRQLHFRRAGRAGDHPPVVLFHQSPASSHAFVEFMADLAADRMVFAPDTPGFGESDLPAQAPEVADYAAAMVAFMDAQRLGKVDLLGYHTGAAIAIEVARRHPERVRKLILVGIPAFTPEEAAAFEAQPWPLPYDEAGDNIAKEWRSTLKWWTEGGARPESMRRSFDQKIANGPNNWWGARAALRYRTIEALAEVKAPILFVRPKDDLWQSSLRVLPTIPQAQRVDVPDLGFGLFETDPERMLGIVRPFLDGEGD